MSMLRRRVARARAAQQNAAMLTTFNEADLGGHAARKQQGDAFEKR